jgi:hypothetical protein
MSSALVNEQKVTDIFAEFIRSGSDGGQDIKQLYEIMPYLNQNQQRVLTLYSTMAVKHDSKVIKEIVTKIVYYASTNRKLGFTFKRNLEAISLFKHFQGYRASAQMNEKDS